ncbi:MAG: transcriptional regulator [Microbacteriaceae bacterium]|nr:transcriptional regulator [Microbacteriaceae bacterium]
MLRDGYESVSVDAIATAAGIGRTTFFRYFGSKPGVIWAPFDATIESLRSAVDTSGAADLDGIRTAIVSSTRAAVYSSEVWLERFQLLDTHPALRADAYEHWERWKRVIAERIAHDEQSESGDAIPMAVAGACQSVFVAELRNPQNRVDDREAVLERLDASLNEVCGALRSLL